MSDHNENCATLHNSIDECDCDKGKIESLQAKVNELTAIINSLTDPNVVWTNMLRGHIGFPQHLKVAKDRVHELEADYESVCQSNKTYEREVPQLRHRIKELEEAMPNPLSLKLLACGLMESETGPVNGATYNYAARRIKEMADRIEKVMKK